MSKIHSAIISAMADIAKVGIAKLSKNKDQGYQFRGIEAAMNEMSPILIRHGIVITSQYSERCETERATRSGGVMKLVTLKGLFRFSAEDGSAVESEAYGEGADISDKATTKAMSVAYRTALFQQFVVPTMAMDVEDANPVDSMPADALAAAERGMKMYQLWWIKQDLDTKRRLEPHHEELKRVAMDADGPK